MPLPSIAAHAVDKRPLPSAMPTTSDANRRQRIVETHTTKKIEKQTHHENSSDRLGKERCKRHHEKQAKQTESCFLVFTPTAFVVSLKNRQPSCFSFGSGSLFLSTQITTAVVFRIRRWQPCCFHEGSRFAFQNGHLRSDHSLARPSASPADNDWPDQVDFK